MKILFCTNAFEVVSNGPAKFAHLLLQINTLYPQHEIRILTEDITIPNSGLIYKQTLNIPFFLKKTGMFLRMFQYHRTAMRIKNTDFNFDYLIYNNAIIGLYSGFRFKNTIGFINDDNNVTASLKNVFRRGEFSKANLFFFVEKIATLTISKIVVNSNYLSALLSKKYKIPENKLFRLYKAIETVPTNYAKHNKLPVILFLKNDYTRGGLFVLLEAIKKLTTPIKLIISGTPDSAYEKINTLCRNSGFEYEISGIISQDRVFQLMQQADIFCVPSLKEALGVANLEAMAHGCSIITTNIGGIPEILGDNNSGWMVAPGNVEALTDALNECITNEKLREDKKINALRIAQKFNITTMLENFIFIVEGNETRR